MSDWRDNLISSPDDVARIVRENKRIAVLGIKTEAQRDQPAFYVPEYMARAGYDIVPVPVYYPDVTEILGRPVYRTVSAVPAPVELVNVFRRPRDIPPTCRTSWPRGPGWSGYSSASATTSPPRPGRRRGSRSCRTAVCWWSTAWRAAAARRGKRI